MTDKIEGRSYPPKPKTSHYAVLYTSVQHLLCQKFAGHRIHRNMLLRLCYCVVNNSNNKKYVLWNAGICPIASKESTFIHLKVMESEVPKFKK